MDLDFLAAAASSPESVASDVCALRLPSAPLQVPCKCTSHAPLPIRKKPRERTERSQTLPNLLFATLVARGIPPGHVRPCALIDAD